MKLSERAERAMRSGSVVLEECNGERLVYCGETVRYRLEAWKADGWAFVSASAWLPDVVGLAPVEGFHARLAGRFPTAWGLPFAASEFLPGDRRR